MQNDLIRIIAEVHIVKAHIAAQLRVGRRTILMRMLPRPDTGFIRRLDEAAFVVVACIDERYIAVVDLRFLVHQLKDTLRACERHDDRIELLRNLCHRHGKRFGQLEEGCDHADGDAVADNTGQCECAADYRDQNIQQITDVAHDRHQDVRKGVCIAGRLTQLIIQRVELLPALVLVAEHLDDLLTVYHLLDIAVDLAERGLLCKEEARGPAADAPDHDEHDRDAKQHEQSQPDVRDEHADEHGNNGHGGREHLRHRLTEHLLERIGIVREVAHEVAMRMRIKITDRQRLHVLEHIVADALEYALRNTDHQPVIKEGRADADEIDDRHAHQRVDKLREHGRRLQEQRRDIIVDQALEEHRTGNVRDGRQRNADQNHAKLNAVVPADIFHQTVQRFFRILAALSAHRSAAAGTAHLRSCHYSSPPFLFCWL